MIRAIIIVCECESCISCIPYSVFFCTHIPINCAFTFFLTPFYTDCCNVFIVLFNYIIHVHNHSFHNWTGSILTWFFRLDFFFSIPYFTFWLHSLMLFKFSFGTQKWLYFRINSIYILRIDFFFCVLKFDTLAIKCDQKMKLAKQVFENQIVGNYFTKPNEWHTFPSINRIEMVVRWKWLIDANFKGTIFIFVYCMSHKMHFCLNATRRKIIFRIWRSSESQNQVQSN